MRMRTMGKNHKHKQKFENINGQSIVWQSILDPNSESSDFNLAYYFRY